MRSVRPARWAFLAAVLIQLVVLYWPWPVGGRELLPHLDKAVHALVFGAVALAGARAGLPSRPLAAVLVAHAGLSEAVQGSVLDQRGADPRDFIADLIGTALGFLLASVVARRPGPGGASDVDESSSRGTLGT
jgi:hypothetical protein